MDRQKRTASRVAINPSTTYTATANGVGSAAGPSMTTIATRPITRPTASTHAAASTPLANVPMSLMCASVHPRDSGRDWTVG